MYSEAAIRQVFQAYNTHNGLAMLVCGLIEFNLSGNYRQEGIDIINYVANAKNVIWAKALMHYLKSNPAAGPHFEESVIVDGDALQQLSIYAGKGDIWAMLILGSLLYKGIGLPNSRKEGQLWLAKSAAGGCLLAKELLSKYGSFPTGYAGNHSVNSQNSNPSRQNQSVEDKMLEEFRDLHGRRWWLKK